MFDKYLYSQKLPQKLKSSEFSHISIIQIKAGCLPGSDCCCYLSSVYIFHDLSLVMIQCKNPVCLHGAQDGGSTVELCLCVCRVQVFIFHMCVHNDSDIQVSVW